jgi:hypothetical protein
MEVQWKFQAIQKWKKLQMGFQVTIAMNVLFMMHWIVGDTEVEMWWNMWMLLQMKLMKLWAIHNFKQILIMVLRMMLVKSHQIYQSLQMRLQNKTRCRRSISLNTFQPWLKMTSQCYNNCRNQCFTLKHGCPNWTFHR